MKPKIQRFETTEAQRTAIAAGIAALGEVIEAHQAANPEHRSFEIELKVKRERPFSKPYDSPVETIGWFNVGNFHDGNGCGKTIQAALENMFAKTDATEKRAYAERCRKAAEQADAEAKELEAAEERANLENYEPMSRRGAPDAARS